MGTTQSTARESARMAALAYFQAEAARLVGTLTTGEADVLRLIAKGLTNRQIAEMLNVSDSTVWQRRATIFSKLGVECSEQACVIATKGMLV